MIPVVFIHFGERPEYAPTVIARAMQAGNDVVFLNPPHSAVYDFPFARVYEHMSTNHVFFELACMVRWFYLRDWMESQGVPDCLYCDTDVLLFANVESEIHSDPYYHAQDFTLSLGTSGHTSYWKRDALKGFCNWMMETYSKRDGDYRELERIYREMGAQGLAGGCTDMTLLKMFAHQEGTVGRVGEMSIPRDGKVWDHNLNSQDGFRMADGRKMLLFHAGDPFGLDAETGEAIRFLSVHFQNGAKDLISEFANRSIGEI